MITTRLRWRPLLKHSVKLHRPSQVVKCVECTLNTTRNWLLAIVVVAIWLGYTKGKIFIICVCSNWSNFFRATQFDNQSGLSKCSCRRACGFQNLVWTPVYRVGIICPPGWDMVNVAAKTWCGHVPTSTCPQARLSCYTEILFSLLQPFKKSW